MDLKELEYKEIIRTCRYWKEEYELKKDMVLLIETMFNSELKNFLEKNPSIKSQWESVMKKKNEYIENLIKQNIDNSNNKNEESAKLNFDEPENLNTDIVIEENIEEKIPTPLEIEVKRLYREIVKLTHPDKLFNKSNSEKEKKIKIYKEATKYYQINDISNIIYCADELGIRYNSDIIEVDILKKDIEKFKQNVETYENSLLWKWYKENKNEEILKIYLNKQIILS